MEFFNKKEEVLDFVLTKKGRELYAKGKLAPYGYRFFDDEVVYDNASGELQNEIAKRIKKDLKVKAITSVVGSNIAKTEVPTVKLYNELGHVTTLTQSAPSWKVIMQEGFVDTGSYISFPTGVKGNTSAEMKAHLERIPQLNLEVKYDIYSENYKNNADKNMKRVTLEKDSNDLLFTFEENNAFDLGEEQELYYEVYKINYDSNNTASLVPLEMSDKEFSSEFVGHYLNILEDDVATQKHLFKIKNIYGTETLKEDDFCEE